MVSLEYKGDFAEKLGQYFRENVFVVGEGPDFRVWMAEQGAVITLDRAHPNSPWIVTFKDEPSYTFFALKYL